MIFPRFYNILIISMRSPKSFTLQPPWGWTLTDPQGELSLGTNKPSWSGLAWERLSISAGLTWHDEGGTVERQVEKKPKKHSLSYAIDWACKQFIKIPLAFSTENLHLRSIQTGSNTYADDLCLAFSYWDVHVRTHFAHPNLIEYS